MNQENFEYLKNQLKYLGFGEQLHQQLETSLKEGRDIFVLPTSAHYNSVAGKKEIHYTLNFKKGNEDMYFLNSYHAAIDNNLGKFYVNNGEKNITSKEAFNLLEGRSVYRELTNKEGEKYNTWQKIDWENSEGESIKFKSFTDNYGYDLEAAMKKVTDQKLYFGFDKQQVMQSLQKGNLVEMKNMDKSEKYFVAADPQFKTMEIFDEKGTKLNLNKINKEQQGAGEHQSAGVKM